MDPRTRSTVATRLATVDPAHTLPSGCRALRTAILTDWPAAVPRPTRAQLVDLIRVQRRARTAARIASADDRRVA